MEALMAATSNAAHHLERHDIGMIRAGAQADIVLLCADPLADISNSRTISAVWTDGRRVSQTERC
jgi:imidazolonepropionase-like amidohydrolase